MSADPSLSRLGASNLRSVAKHQKDRNCRSISTASQLEQQVSGNTSGKWVELERLMLRNLPLNGEFPTSIYNVASIREVVVLSDQCIADF